MRFDNLVIRLLEDFNVYPRARDIGGRPAPSPGPNIDSRGALPTGFKGANLPGIAPDPGQTVFVKVPKKKEKIT
jgi:hypothetical protein